MSVSPRQNFLKPPPVPEIPTVTFTAPFLAFWYSSATASVTGKTVLEPSILTTFCCAEAIGENARAAATDAAAAEIFMSFIGLLLGKGSVGSFGPDPARGRIDPAPRQ